MGPFGAPPFDGYFVNTDLRHRFVLLVREHQRKARVPKVKETVPKVKETRGRKRKFD